MCIWLWTRQLRVGRNVACAVSRGRGSKRDPNTQDNTFEHTASLGGREKVGGAEGE